MGTSVISTAGTDNGRRILGLKLCMERHTGSKKKGRLFCSGRNTKGRPYRFKMFLSESSTNTDNEVFQKPRGLNKLLWKVERKNERQRRMKWRL